MEALPLRLAMARLIARISNHPLSYNLSKPIQIETPSELSETIVDS